jgi:hypothetical protein
VAAGTSAPQRRAEGRRGPGHALDGLDQGAEFARVVGIADAEVVQQAEFVRVGAGQHELAHAFVDHRQAHAERVGLAPLGEQGQSQGEAAAAAVDLDHAAVLGRVAARAGQRLEHGVALDLVVVLADHRGARADREIAQQVQQQCPRVKAGGRRDRGRRRTPPFRAQLAARRVVEFHAIQLADHLAVVAHLEDARAVGVAEFGEFGLEGRGQLAQPRQARRLDRQHHALLAFGKKDLPRRQARLLQGHPLQQTRRRSR